MNAHQKPGSDIQTFHFEGVPFRVIDEAGAWWFIAADASKPLGYTHTPHMLRSLDDDEKGVHTMDTPGGRQDVSVISEPGLYRAIMQRRVTKRLTPEMKAAIERFQRWVYHDVLPSIRKTGSYQHEGVVVTELDAATRSAIGGMIKRNTGVVLREALAPVEAKLSETTARLNETAARLHEIEERIQSPLTCTAKELWEDFNLPPLRGGTVWLGNRLIEMGCLPEFGSRSKLGGSWRRQFDAGRARAAMKNGLILHTERYIEKRRGQMSFHV